MKWKVYKRIWHITEKEKEIVFSHIRFFDIETEAKEYLDQQGGIIFEHNEYQFVEQNIMSQE
jgi:hypothetical protein